MKEFLKKNRTVIIIILVILIGLFIFSTFFNKGDKQNQPIVKKTVNSTTKLLGAEILSALNSLKVLKLDANIFVDPAFKSLVDFSRPVLEEPIGRKNPFAPIDEKEIIYGGNVRGVNVVDDKKTENDKKTINNQ